MKITLLGTGTSQGIPVIGCDCPTCKSADSRDARLRCSAVVEADGVKLLIDTSPDLRQQMLKNEVDRIDAVLYTHEHNDHMVGIDDIRPFNFKQGGKMPLYGLERVLKEIEQRFSYVFKVGPYLGAPRAVTNYIEAGISFQVEKVKVIPIPIVHGTLDILGYRIGDFAYITDASLLTEEAISMLRDLEVLIINALHKRIHPSHFTLEEALSYIELINPKKAYITHLSHHMGITKEWELQLPENVFPAFDGLEISISS